MQTGNYLIDGDNGSDCRSPLHSGGELCNPKKEIKEPRYCTYCNEELTEEEDEVCEWCSEHKNDE